MKSKLFRHTALWAVLALSMATARASLNTSYVFNGRGNWSIDAVGSLSTPVGDIQAFVPVGATVQKAFLYSSTTPDFSPAPTVNFDGTIYSGAQWTSLGSNGVGLRAFRTDVTSQIAAKVGLGNALPFTFSVLSETPNAQIDGEVLAIIYSSPLETYRTLAFLDGFSSTNGDSTSINLSAPLTAAQLADANFEAQLSLGIGFSAGGSQRSIVDINGSRLTSSAGGFDDGSAPVNGCLITAGGLGDSLANPVNPNLTTAPDDELYSLKPYLSAGQSSIQIHTLNPSGDDNIFFAGVNITALGGVNAPAPPAATVPDAGSTLLLLALGVGGLATLHRKHVFAQGKIHLV